jgi:hypothetical protein
MSEDTSAAEALNAPASEESGEDPAQRDDTYFLPASVLDGKEAKAGDVLRFKVVGTDGDSVEVECMDNEQPEMDWREDMRRSVSNEGQQ